MATYKVDVTHKFPQRKPAERNVILEANSPAKAQKDALAALAAKYPQHEVLEVQVQRLDGPMITQGLKFMPCNYIPPAKLFAQAVSEIQNQRTGYLSTPAPAVARPKETAKA